jgi:hypothetical protein
MRLSLLLALSLFVPVMALAQTLKQVEVTNLPEVQDVFVTNEVPSAPAPPRFQFVGFTSATYTANLGGYFGAARKCQLDFPDSRICEYSEVARTTVVSLLTGMTHVFSRA